MSARPGTPQSSVSSRFDTDSFLGSVTNEEYDTRKTKWSPTRYTGSPLDEGPLPHPMPVNSSATELRISTASNTGFPSKKVLLVLDPKDAWRKRLLNVSTRMNWIDMLFASKEIYFDDTHDEYAWELQRKLFEEASHNSNQPYATAVYECSQTKGRVRGPKALMKIYMQIPCCCDTCEQTCMKFSAVPDWITREIAALKRVSQVSGRVNGPRLLATKKKSQTRNMWVPDGFLTFIVTQRLPGTRLVADTFWSLPARTRDDIRISFKRALESLWQAGIMPRKCAVEKITWDQISRKCYIVDLPDAETVSHALRWWDYEFYRWGLSKTSFEPWETPLHKHFDTQATLVDNKINFAIDKARMKEASCKQEARRVRFALTGPAG